MSAHIRKLIRRARASRWNHSPPTRRERVSTRRAPARRSAAAGVLAVVAGLVGPGNALAEPPISQTGPDVLQRAYRGDDGSAYYQTIHEQTVVGFGEHPGKDYAFVFKGTRSANGKTISGRFWDIAKGGRGQRGALSFTVSHGGSRLTVMGGSAVGPAVFEAHPTEAGPWAGSRPAGFQSTSATDLDGVFTGSDFTRAYVREIAGDVVWLNERAGKAGGRPMSSTVFVGRRTKTGSIKGDWWDVPKGVRAYRGWFGAASLKKHRRTRVVRMRHGVSSHDIWLEPDYRVDFDELAQAIDVALEGKVVGFGWAVAHNGKVVREGGGGRRHLDGKPGQGDRPFTSTTENASASSTKLVTAALVVRALKARGKSLDQRVEPYLPKTWHKGKHVSWLTFRHLLDHTAGLHYAGKTVCSKSPMSVSSRRSSTV